ncbi:MAG: prepilin-type N-terminal cleavage/methylation domain-containing protein [Chthoniobacterales bacterium]
MSPVLIFPGFFKRKIGFTLTEILISMTLLAIIFLSITSTFLVLNRQSSRSRIGTAAVVMAQQEIDDVMSARPYTATSSVPQILRVQSEGGTLATGDSWAASGTDASGRAYSVVISPVGLQIGANKGTTIVNGQLLRKITIINSSLRQVDVTVGYNYRGSNSATNNASYTYTTQAAFESAYRYQVRFSTFRSLDE